MTVVVVILLPVVLLYQGWTYYVFRQRVTPGDVQPPRVLGTRRPGGRLPADEAGGHRNAQTGGPPV
jgi:hypothetical protein